MIIPEHLHNYKKQNKLPKHPGFWLRVTVLKMCSVLEVAMCDNVLLSKLDWHWKAYFVFPFLRRKAQVKYKCRYSHVNSTLISKQSKRPIFFESRVLIMDNS